MNLHQLINLGLRVGGILIGIAIVMQLYFLARAIGRRSKAEGKPYRPQEAKEQQRQDQRFNETR